MFTTVGAGAGSGRVVAWESARIAGLAGEDFTRIHTAGDEVPARCFGIG